MQKEPGSSIGRRISPISLLIILPLFLMTGAGVLGQSRGQIKEQPNWATYFGTTNAWRYSPLDQIKADNVKSLVPVWALQTGKIEGGLNATPIVIDGIMYLIASENRVFALNAETGERLWTYNYRFPRDLIIPYGKFNRGLAVGLGLIFFGTVDNHVVALDAKTGKEVWNVEVEDPKICGCNINGAPFIVNDKVIVGGTGGDSAHRGYINAFYAKTGRLAWRFYTIPGPGEPGHETWPKDNDAWKYGGAAIWQTPAMDPELGLIYFSTGNAAPDYNGAFRAGDNLYAASIVAIDLATGKYRWHFQEVHHDIWDYDAVNPVILMDVTIAGRTRKAIAEVGKTGWAYILDRTN